MDGNKVSIQDMTKMALFLAMIIVSSYIRIPIGLVPVTLQFTVILITCLVLPRFQGTYTVAMYIVLGLIGVPVFTQGAGLAYVFQVHFGYLLGFLMMSIVVGILKKKQQNFWFLSIVGYFILYITALTYVYFLMRFYLHTDIAILPFIQGYQLIFFPSDMVSLVIAVTVARQLMRRKTKQ